MKVPVNGTLYDKIAYDATTRQITLSSTKHSGSFVTTMSELSEQYGRRTAYLVAQALNSKGIAT